MVGIMGLLSSVICLLGLVGDVATAAALAGAPRTAIAGPGLPLLVASPTIAPPKRDIEDPWGTPMYWSLDSYEGRIFCSSYLGLNGWATSADYTIAEFETRTVTYLTTKTICPHSCASVTETSTITAASLPPSTITISTTTTLTTTVGPMKRRSDDYRRCIEAAPTFPGIADYPPKQVRSMCWTLYDGNVPGRAHESGTIYGTATTTISYCTTTSKTITITSNRPHTITTSTTTTPQDISSVTVTLLVAASSTTTAS